MSYCLASKSIGIRISIFLSEVITTVTRAPGSLEVKTRDSGSPSRYFSLGSIAIEYSPELAGSTNSMMTLVPTPSMKR